MKICKKLNVSPFFYPVGPGISTFSDSPPITVYKSGVRKLFEATEPQTRLLKDYGTDTMLVLTLIHQASIDQGTVPADWKHAWVIPVYKKGKIAMPSNYKPISLKSILLRPRSTPYPAT